MNEKVGAQEQAKQVNTRYPKYISDIEKGEETSIWRRCQIM